MKLLRTIRLDPSDTFVFDRAAEPGEWAVTGAFVFWNAIRRRSKARRARRFAAGFSALQSLGWSTLVQIVEASDDDRARRGRYAGEATGREFRRAQHRGGAARPPKRKSRSPTSLCNHPARHADRRASHASRTAKSARRSAPCAREDGPKPLRAFSFLEVEGEDEPAEGRPRGDGEQKTKRAVRPGATQPSGWLP